MKNLVSLSIVVLFAIVATSCSSGTSYDSSKETPELKAKYDKMLEDAKPQVIVELISLKWLGEGSKYQTKLGTTIEDCLLSFRLDNDQEISFRTSQFANSELLGPHSIVKVVFNEQGKVVRLTRANL